MSLGKTLITVIPDVAKSLNRAKALRWIGKNAYFLRNPIELR
jgi:hypothetical protein